MSVGSNYGQVCSTSFEGNIISIEQNTVAENALPKLTEPSGLDARYHSSGWPVGDFVFDEDLSKSNHSIPNTVP